MPVSQCVKNDAEIPSRPFFVIITGANMAGKSTYLRTIGVNTLIMAIPTVISGIYGMNVSSKWVPLATTAHGFMIIIGVIVVICVLILILLKKKRIL